MGKKRQTNISKHIKTRHKKPQTKRTIVTQKVNPAIRNVNQVITKLVMKQEEKGGDEEPPQYIPMESMPLNSFKKLLGDEGNKKEKMGKLSVDDSMYLEKMLKRWGNNYARMAQDIKLNRMQWTAQQIQKKH